MTQAVPTQTEDPLRGPRLSGAMTIQLALRQTLLLLAAATAFWGMLFFFDLYGLVTFDSLWNNLPNVEWGWFSLPLLFVLVYGYILFNGLLFSLGPSERSFNVFFGIMVLAVLVVNYDHSIIDWPLNLLSGGKVGLRPDDLRPVHPFKILFAGVFFLIISAMHYNVMADDFARRMIRRGVPAKEAFAIRPGMFKVLGPAMATAAAIAFGISLVGFVGFLAFGSGGLFLPKLQLVLLAALLVPVAFLVRGIIRDLAAQRKSTPRGPNR